MVQKIKDNDNTLEIHHFIFAFQSNQEWNIEINKNENAGDFYN